MDQCSSYDQRLDPAHFEHLHDCLPNNNFDCLSAFSALGNVYSYSPPESVNSQWPLQETDFPLGLHLDGGQRLPLHVEPRRLYLSDDVSISACTSPTITTGGASSQPDDTGRYSCTECESSFESRQKLEKHALNSDHRCFRCPIVGCGKSYKRRDLYTRHKKTHQALASFYCEFCPVNHRKSFKRKDHLQQHRKTCHPGTLAEEAQERSAVQAPQCRCRCGYRKNSNCSDDSISEAESHGQSPAVREIIDEVGIILGDDMEHDERLKLLRRQLDLQEGATPKQFARSLVQLAAEHPDMLRGLSRSPRPF